MLRTFVLSCAAVGLLGFAVGCKVESTPSGVSITTKDAAVKDVETKLKGLEATMTDLEAKAKVATGDAKTELEKKWNETAGKRDAAKKKLEELKNAAEDKWKDIHKEADKAYDDLKKAVQ